MRMFVNNILTQSPAAKSFSVKCIIWNSARNTPPNLYHREVFFAFGIVLKHSIFYRSVLTPISPLFALSQRESPYIVSMSKAWITYWPKYYIMRSNITIMAFSIGHSYGGKIGYRPCIICLALQCLMRSLINMHVLTSPKHRLRSKIRPTHWRQREMVSQYDRAECRLARASWCYVREAGNRPSDTVVETIKVWSRNSIGSWQNKNFKASSQP